MKVGKLYFIKWEDAHSMDSWTDIKGGKEFNRVKGNEVSVVGFLVDKNKSGIVLAAMQSANKKGYSMLARIPTASIISINELSKEDNV